MIVIALDETLPLFDVLSQLAIFEIYIDPALNILCGVDAISLQKQ